MNERIGQADARISLLRGKLVKGALAPAIAALMDGLDPTWRENPSVALWETGYASYDEWSRSHRRAPQPKDKGAAGLHGWLEEQKSAAAAGTLTGKQIRALQNLHGWTGNIAEPAAQLHYSTAARLREAHFPLGTTHGKARAGEVLTNWADAGGVLVDQPVIPAESAHLPAFRGLFGYVFFYAQNLRQPAAGEPGAKWLADARTEGLTQIPWVRDLRATIPGADSEAGLSDAWRARYDRYVAFRKQNHRPPQRRGASVEERACAHWYGRQLVRIRNGHGSAAETSAVSGLSG